MPRPTSARLIPVLLVLGLLSPAAAGGQSSPEGKLRVTAEQANVRAEPDIGSRILIQAPAEAVFAALEKIGEWFHIRYVTETGETLEGFVHESLVSVIRPVSQSEEKPPVKAPPETRPEEAMPPPEKVENPVVIKPPVETKPQEKPHETTPPEKQPESTPPPEKPAEPLPQTPVETEPFPSSVFPSENRHGSDLALVSGGLFSAVGDLNRGAQGMAGYYRDLLQSGAQGEAHSLHLGWRFGGEMRYFLTERLALGFGADFEAGRRESSVNFSGGEALTVRPEIRVIPFRAFVTYDLTSRIYLKAGLEYNFAESAYYYRYQEGDTWQEWQGEAQSHGPGLLGGIGWRCPVSRRLEFFVEALGRYASLGGFEGEDRFSDSDGRETKQEGLLYIYTVQMAGEKTHRLLFVRDRVPSEAGVTDPSEAGLNLSGLCLRTGIRLRF